MKHLGTKYLETENLILRKFTIDDANDVFNEYGNDEHVTKYLTWKFHKNINDSKEIINIWVNNYENKDFYQWAIVSKKNNKVIGSISVVKYSKNNQPIVGYCLGKKYWNNGIVTEAFKKVIDF